MMYKDVIYAYYRSAFKGDASLARLESSARRLRHLVEPWLVDVNRDSVIVDLGCGAGELLMSYAQLGFRNLAGCDLSAEQVAVAQRRFRGVIQADLITYLESFEDGSVDLLSIFDVIEHLGPQLTFDLFALAEKKLKRGGLLLVHLPNGVSPFVGAVLWGDMTHSWCLTPASAETLCRLHGFSGFEAVEHLGVGRGLGGLARRIIWVIVKAVYRIFNFVETGSSGGNVWTRNFAFKAVRES